MNTQNNDEVYDYLAEPLSRHGMDLTADFKDQYLRNPYVYHLSNIIRHQEHRIRVLEAEREKVKP